MDVKRAGLTFDYPAEFHSRVELSQTVDQHMSYSKRKLKNISKRKLKPLYRPFWREHAPHITTLIVEAASQVAVS